LQEAAPEGQEQSHRVQVHRPPPENNVQGLPVQQSLVLRASVDAGAGRRSRESPLGGYGRGRVHRRILCRHPERPPYSQECPSEGW